jgi:hypothetical protein
VAWENLPAANRFRPVAPASFASSRRPLLHYTELTAECAVPFPVQADGDTAASLPLTIKLRPDPFKFH